MWTECLTKLPATINPAELLIFQSKAFVRMKYNRSLVLLLMCFIVLHHTSAKLWSPEQGRFSINLPLPSAEFDDQFSERVVGEDLEKMPERANSISEFFVKTGDQGINEIKKSWDNSAIRIWG